MQNERFSMVTDILNLFLSIIALAPIITTITILHYMNALTLEVIYSFNAQISYFAVILMVSFLLSILLKIFNIEDFFQTLLDQKWIKFHIIINTLLFFILIGLT